MRTGEGKFRGEELIGEAFHFFVSQFCSRLDRGSARVALEKRIEIGSLIAQYLL